MTETLNVAKFELDTLTRSAFQQSLHLPADGDEEIDSRFSYQFKKTSWSSQMSEKLESNSNDGKIIYTANHKFDFLMNTCMVQQLPALRVLKEYRKNVQICWPHNVNHNIIIDGNLCFDDDTVQKVNSVWLDIYSQFYMKAGFRDHYNIMSGTVPFLEKWTEYLPSFPVICPQPWFYGRNTAVSIPLFLCSKSRVTHNYSIRTKISDILRMRVFNPKTNKWAEIKYNFKYLEGVTEQELVKKPEMWGRYALISDSEREWRRTLTHEIYSEDMIMASSENSNKFGSSVPVSIHSDMPLKAVHWVAENVDASKMNNRSNYTTNTKDYFKGWNPIKSPQLTYGGSVRIPKMSHYHFDSIEAWYNFPSPPSEHGYNAYSICYDVSSLHADVGVVLSGLSAKLTCTLGNTDPFLSKVIDRRRQDPQGKEYGHEDLVPDEAIEEKSQDDINSPNFKIHVLLLVTRKIVFENGIKVRLVKDTPIQSTIETPLPSGR